jgi:hypothetical protein
MTIRQGYLAVHATAEPLREHICDGSPRAPSCLSSSVSALGSGAVRSSSLVIFQSASRLGPRCDPPGTILQQIPAYQHDRPPERQSSLGFGGNADCEASFVSTRAWVYHRTSTRTCVQTRSSPSRVLRRSRGPLQGMYLQLARFQCRPSRINNIPVVREQQHLRPPAKLRQCFDSRRRPVLVAGHK